MPVEKMDAETVEMYAEDRRARAQEEVFLPLRRLFARTTVSLLLLLENLRRFCSIRASKFELPLLLLPCRWRR